jgi:hypothetical protein
MLFGCEEPRLLPRAFVGRAARRPALAQDCVERRLRCCPIWLRERRCSAAAREQVMHHSANRPFPISGGAAIEPPLRRAIVALLLSGIGLIAGAILVSSVLSGPTRDPRSHKLSHEQASGSYTPVSLAVDTRLASDPSPFVYLVFDWDGPVPGFGPLDPGPDPLPPSERRQ